jgi:DNA modification methylase
MVFESYKTRLGKAFNSSIEDFVLSDEAISLAGGVDLILTSPPYPLLSPKAYGNLSGEEYLRWIVSVIESLLPHLNQHGSLVVEIGNTWERGQPTMSTLPLETLLAIKNSLNLEVCQMFIWENPNKLPGPAIWVNKDRVRVKDSFTHLWWFSKSPNPKANNRNVLKPYSKSMEKLLERQSYNKGIRPSGHKIGDGFLKSESTGAIPGSVLIIPNSKESSEYRDWCKKNGYPQHPARMPSELAKFFIEFLTEPGDLVFDPFGGSNTTGSTAETLKRRWVVTEMSNEYFNGSKGRFEGEIEG